MHQELELWKAEQAKKKVNTKHTNVNTKTN